MGNPIYFFKQNTFSLSLSINIAPSFFNDFVESMSLNINNIYTKIKYEWEF